VCEHTLGTAALVEVVVNERGAAGGRGGARFDARAG